MNKSYAFILYTEQTTFNIDKDVDEGTEEIFNVTRNSVSAGHTEYLSPVIPHFTYHACQTGRGLKPGTQVSIINRILAHKPSLPPCGMDNMFNLLLISNNNVDNL
jgi:hypothetical protein